MSPGRSRVVVILRIAALLPVLAFDWSSKFTAVDSCMDRGGGHGYRAARCTTARKAPETLPFSSYYSRKRDFVLGSVVASELLLFGVK